MAPDLIRCRDRCGATAETEESASTRGWSFLAVAGGWRCGSCARILLEASFLQGDNSITADTLPADSRGALPKETASTITPPVRGL